MNNLTDAHKLHGEITSLQSEYRELKNASTLNNYAKATLTISTFLIYIAFTSVIYAGVSIFGIQDYLTGGKLNAIGIVFTVLIVFIMPLGLSLVKHVNYDVIAKTGNTKRLLVSAIISLTIISGVSYEAISASSNMQEKINRTVANSEVGKAILNTGGSISNSSVYASMIAEAEFKLVACQRKMADGIYKDCNNSQAKLDSLKAQADAERENARQAGVDAIAAKQAAIEKERDANVIYAGQVVGNFFGVDAKTGLLILLLYVAILFELIHATVIFNEFNHWRQRRNLEGAIKSGQNRYFELTNKRFNARDFTDKSVIDLDEMRNVPENEMGGSDGGYKSSSPGFGFVPNRHYLKKPSSPYISQINNF